MRRTILALSAAGLFSVGLVGCATNELETRREVASAALSKYPGGQAQQSSMYTLTAVDYPDKQMIEVLNSTDNSVPAAKIWVNGRYVANTPPILARSSYQVKYGDLMAAGADVSDIAIAKAKVVKVELQLDSGLIAVQGPAIK